MPMSACDPEMDFSGELEESEKSEGASEQTSRPWQTAVTEDRMR